MRRLCLRNFGCGCCGLWTWSPWYWAMRRALPVRNQPIIDPFLPLFLEGRTQVDSNALWIFDSRISPWPSPSWCPTRTLHSTTPSNLPLPTSKWSWLLPIAPYPQHYSLRAMFACIYAKCILALPIFRIRCATHPEDKVAILLDTSLARMEGRAFTTDPLWGRHIFFRDKGWVCITALTLLLIAVHEWPSPPGWSALLQVFQFSSPIVAASPILTITVLFFCAALLLLLLSCLFLACLTPLHTKTDCQRAPESCRQPMKA